MEHAGQSELFHQLVKSAIALGATDAKLISTALIPIEDEVLEMCRKPHCNGFGKSANCPPHTLKPSEFREFIKAYDHALLFKIDVPLDVMLSDKQSEAFRKIYEIASKVETEARQNGLERSRGYAAGSCKPVFCKDHNACRALEKKGSCRFPDVARPSMESVGMNVLKLLSNAGWEIQMMTGHGLADPPADVVLSGLVILA